MSPLNLEDVERYLVDQGEGRKLTVTYTPLVSWLHARFHELREREKAIGRT